MRNKCHEKQGKSLVAKNKRFALHRDVCMILDWFVSEMRGRLLLYDYIIQHNKFFEENVEIINFNSYLYS